MAETICAACYQSAANINCHLINTTIVLNTINSNAQQRLGEYNYKFRLISIIYHQISPSLQREIYEYIHDGDQQNLNRLNSLNDSIQNFLNEIAELNCLDYMSLVIYMQEFRNLKKLENYIEKFIQQINIANSE